MSKSHHGPGSWIHTRCEISTDRVVSPEGWEARFSGYCPRCQEPIELGELTSKIYIKPVREPELDGQMTIEEVL